MSVTTELLGIIETAHSPSGVLEGAVRVMAQRLHAAACWAFLLDDQSNVYRAAVFGADAGAAREASQAQAVASRALLEQRSFIHDEGDGSWLVSPMILRGSSVGALVLQDAERSYSVDDIATLATACAQLVGLVEHARIVESLARGESPVPRARTPAKRHPDGEYELRGVPASPGVASGRVLFRGAFGLEQARSAAAAADPVRERARAEDAIMRTHADVLRIQRQAAREIDEEHALIFASHLLLLNDPALLEHVGRELSAGASASTALGRALDDFERQLRLVPDAYIREKVDDIDDLRSRLLDHLRDVSHSSATMRVVVSRRIPPSLVVEMKTEGALALVTEVGGANSHGVLLARAMGVPVVTGVADMLDGLEAGDVLAVDGSNGVVVVHPSERTLARFAEERSRLAQARAYYGRFRSVLAASADGVRIPLHANVGVSSDLSVARENGAEAIGLYRTEFPFLVRDAFPTREEQVRIYAKAYELFPDAPIQFRILDLGGDKFLSHGPLSPSRNPFHGYRSIRVLFDHPEVLRDQVQAFALAAGDRPLRIMIPMLSSLEDLRRTRALIEGALSVIPRTGSTEVGAMIEVPAAVEVAEELAREVDFLSIGTNDLMQYALVVDREDSHMARAADPYHPAILRMIARVASAASRAGKPLSVCGEIAARPDLALAMVALGVGALSVVPGAIPELKQSLVGMHLGAMRQAMPKILQLADAASVAAALKAVCVAG